MPGKTDFGAGGQKGNYGFASKESKAWDEGWQYRYGGTAAARPIGDNPYNGTGLAKEAAWNAGWNEAEANSFGARRMPATSGPPIP